jgi:hypothetical protein
MKGFFLLLFVLCISALRFDEQLGSEITIPFHYPLFKQCNSSWANEIMVTTTICKVGCLMSSVSMALNGHNILIDGQLSNPHTLNQWLRKNGGYDNNDDLYEDIVPKINPQRIVWLGSKIPGKSLSPEVVKQYLLSKNTVVIANVRDGGHFVLVVGFDETLTKWYVNDPGFDVEYYTYDQVVGWRLFKMV